MGLFTQSISDAVSRDCPLKQEASAECETPAAQRSGSHRSGGNPESGAPPSNTAPVEYTRNGNSLLKILRYGIDSLYLSYPGSLSLAWDETLSKTKELAQSRDPVIQATAQVELNGHLFEVLDHGRGMFAYVLADNHYNISLSSALARHMPLASVQLSSELLHSFGPIEAEENLWAILLPLSSDIDELRISRADLYVDFVAGIDFKEILDEQWVTQARRIDRYQIDGAFTGWAFGRSDMHARLYNKSLEIRKSGKDYFLPLWNQAGWDGEATIWRMEFQFRRERLKQFIINGLNDFIDQIGSLWHYATQNWLRLTSPNPSDTNRARWDMHPIWSQLSALDWGTSFPPSRVPVLLNRPPSDEVLFERGLWPLSSYMAREVITDPREAYERYLIDADKHHLAHKGKPLNEYLLSKIALKGRKYNTLRSSISDDGVLTIEPFGEGGSDL